MKRANFPDPRPEERDEQKQRSAEIFLAAWRKVLEDEKYAAMKEDHKRATRRSGR